MTLEEKGKLSHRARAFSKLVDFLQSYQGWHPIWVTVFRFSKILIWL
jgi:hypothetical protein